MENTIKECMITLPKDSKLYLIWKLSDSSGFFCTDGKLIYLVVNYENLKSENIDTVYLSMKTNIQIKAVDNHPEFTNGFYNLVFFKGDSNDQNIESFIKLCKLHSNNSKELGFAKFFYSIVNLFQLSKEQETKNIIGLYGELKFIQEVFLKLGISLANNWHLGLDSSKYDFYFNGINFEVKTHLSEEKNVIIKHRQIFNGDNNFLVIVSIENNPSGETLNQLIKDLNSHEVFFNNFNFQLELEKELRRISQDDFFNKYMQTLGFSIFDVNELETISNIPDNISELTYRYSFEGIECVELALDIFS